MIQSRDREKFYTGGVLGGGEHLLPRDYDLDILVAIAIAGARSAQQVQFCPSSSGDSAAAEKPQRRTTAPQLGDCRPQAV